MGLKDGNFKTILDEAKLLSPEERGEMLLKPDENCKAFYLINAHQELAMEGQTELNPNEKVNHHFAAFVEKGGNLYELDGRKAFPINHGPTTDDTFLEVYITYCYTQSTQKVRGE